MGDPDSPPRSLSLSDLRKLQKKLLAAKFSEGIVGLYHHSRSRIFKIADKIAAGVVEGKENIRRERGTQIPLPLVEKWDFKLGDAVKVKYPLKDFESIQRRTIGWRTGLVVIHGHVGFVTSVMSQYDSVINVIFPEIYQGCSLYAGVLEKVSSSQLTSHSSRWKVGDMVKPKADDVLEVALQKGLKNIPNEFLGKKGRVTAIGSVHVEVTFDEKRSIQISHALLDPCEDNSPIKISKEETANTKFEVGEKVKVISNMKTLIINQKNNGGWNKEMSKLRGQVVTILNIPKDSVLLVYAEHQRPWHLAADSVLKLDGAEEYTSNELEFLPGDLVKLKIPRDIGKTFSLEEVPMEFLEYLGGVAKIEYVDDDFDCYVMFNQSQKVMINPKELKKCSDEEIENYQQTLAKVDLKVGDDVHLDIGPPNYVREIIQGTGLGEHVKTAVTSSAKLVGFIDYDTAVVEYEGGTRYKIAFKYLTVPDKFKVKRLVTVLDLGTAKIICDTISEAVRVLYYNNVPESRDWSVDVTSMAYGSPPSMEVRIQSVTGSLAEVVDWLRKNKYWKMTNIYGGQFFLFGVDGFDSEIKLSINFNNNDKSTGTKQATKSITKTIIEEQGKIENGAVGFVDPDEVLPGQPSCVQQPNLANMRYRLQYDSSMRQYVYVPYLPAGPQIAPTPPLVVEQQPQYQGNVACENFTINQCNNF